MVKNTIKIYGRLKPSSTNIQETMYHICHANECAADTLILSRFSSEVHVSKEDKLKFRFNKVFDQFANQKDIFDIVAKPVVESVLYGYNGTVFAYGQTGSGKTFTVTGGVKRYEERGIIPRSIQHIFQILQQGESTFSTVYISYLEIYNEHGFDLLDPRHGVSKLEDLPHVSLLEDASGKLHLRNLSIHPVTTEEEALNLLFLGDSNRIVTETPMNPHSSRSHCIFTVHLKSRNPKSSAVRHSKLNLVDLAGSERVYKTQLGGQMLVEARHINLSLHFLEQVILALGDSNRSHIPYRNSMMTTILRDSLGGNCLTVMVATICLSINNIEESLSTCRFAQRVALVSNDVNLNEELDPQEEIAILRAEVQELKTQLAKHTDDQNKSALTSADINECKELVQTFLQSDTSIEFPHIHNDRKIQFCFNLLKNAILEAKQGTVSNYSDEKEEMKKCLQQLKLRDHEISVLINLLKKEKKPFHCETEKNMVLFQGCFEQPAQNRISVSSKTSNSSNCTEKSESDQKTNEVKITDFKNFLADPKNRLELDDCQLKLKTKYKEAKNVAAELKQSQITISILHNKLKNCIEDYSIGSLKNPSQIIETQNKLKMEQIFYKEKLEKLRNIKFETDRLKCCLQQIKRYIFIKFQKQWKNLQNYNISNDGSHSFSNTTSDSSTTFSNNKETDKEFKEFEKHIVPENLPKSNSSSLSSTMNRTDFENIDDEYIVENSRLKKMEGLILINGIELSLPECSIHNVQDRISHSLFVNDTLMNRTSYNPVCSLTENETHTCTDRSTYGRPTFPECEYYQCTNNYAELNKNKSFDDAMNKKTGTNIQPIKCQEIYESNYLENIASSAEVKHTNKDNRNFCKHPTNITKSIVTENFNKEFMDFESTNVTTIYASNVLTEIRHQEKDLHVVNLDSVPLTGDPEIDEEIIAFYKARSQLVCR